MALGLSAPVCAAFALRGQVPEWLLAIMAAACVLEWFPLHLPGGRRFSASVFCYVLAADQYGFSAASAAILVGVATSVIRTGSRRFTRAHLRRLLFSLGAHQLALAPTYALLERVPFLPCLFRTAIAAVVFEVVRLIADALFLEAKGRFRSVLDALRSLHPVTLLIPASLASLLSAPQMEWPVVLPTAALFASFAWLSRRQAQLVDECESARQTYRVIADHSADLVLIAESSGEIVFASPGFLSARGVTADALIGCSVLDLVAPEDFAMFDEWLTPEGADGRDRELAMEIGGARVDVELRITPIETHSATRYVIQARDISARLRKTADRVREERLEALGQLAASIAHEFRNPLTTVMGFVQLFRDQLEELAPGAYAAMWGELERIKDVTDALMVLAKPEDVPHVACDLGAIAETAAAVCQPLALERGVKLACGPLEPAQVLGHPGQLRQMFVSLLRNAIEAAAEAQGDVSLSVTATEVGAIATIQHAGEGIPTSLSARPGEPFYDTSERGTGLELMVAHRIALEHGGNLEVKRTTQPRKTVLRLRFPQGNG